MKKMLKKTTRIEQDFFSHFDNVEFVDIPTDSPNKYVMSQERMRKLYRLEDDAE